jgi:hypothetical protein
MYKLSVLCVSIFILAWVNVSHAADSLLDEPEFDRDLSMPCLVADSYDRALHLWKKAEDINKWVAAGFIYDKVRAMKLSSNHRMEHQGIPIYSPSEFFESKTGVCVDLARFGVETLRGIDPKSDPKYLMIEFDPIQINGNTFRWHWLVSFKRDGMKYFFCDSKRPGYIAGPYNTTQEFISEYEQYRGRRIVTHRELDSYQKQRKSLSTKGRVTKSPDMPSAADR